MKRVRINFGRDFCGQIKCNLCFRDVGDKEQNIKKNKFLVEEYVKSRPVQQEIKQKGWLAQIKCPGCNGRMVIRTNRNNGQQFLGCANFPDCRGTRPLPQGVGEIPAAKQELVKEIIFDDLLSRPAKLSAEQIKTDGAKLEFLEQEKKNEIKRNGPS